MNFTYGIYCKVRTKKEEFEEELNKYSKNSI